MSEKETPERRDPRLAVELDFLAKLSAAETILEKKFREYETGLCRLRSLIAQATENVALLKSGKEPTAALSVLELCAAPSVDVDDEEK